MKKEILILTCFLFSSCTNMDAEINLRKMEMAMFERQIQMDNTKPQPILYESTASDGAKVVVYMPVSAMPKPTYVSRPIPKTDWSFLYPILNVVATITGQYFGFRTTDSMYSFLKGVGASSTSYSTTTNTDSSVKDSYGRTVDKSVNGDYSGNLGTGQDNTMKVKDSGNTKTVVNDAFKSETIDNSDHSTKEDAVYTPTVITPTVITPVIPAPVITPVINNTSEN